jgi:tetratricopeptide (TPR) repeat protein
MAVEKGYVSAMYNLAILYEIEHKDFEKAEKYCLMAAEKDHVGAMNSLAILYETEHKDFEKAEKYYLMAVEKGHVGAMCALARLYQTEHKDLKKAKEYYLMAVKKSDTGAMNNLAYLYYKQKINKKRAIELAEKACQKKGHLYYLHTLATVLVWGNQIEAALAHVVKLLEDKEAFERFPEDMANLFMLLIAKKQYHSALKFFEDKASNLKEQLKPVYYALMHFMQDEYPNEYKKAGSEIKETVEEIVKEIEHMAIDYA